MSSLLCLLRDEHEEAKTFPQLSPWNLFSRFFSDDSLLYRRLAQEREYSKLIDTANAPIFGVDIDGRVNVWNQCAMRLVGYSPDEVMGHSLVQEFITKDYQASVQMVLDQALKGKETANFEFPLMTKANVPLDVLLNATTRRDEQGNIIGVVGIGQDITGRIAQER